MPVITVASLNDLVQTTLAELNKPDFTDISTDVREFTVMDRLVLNEKNVVVGKSIDWRVNVNPTYSFQNVGLGAEDSPIIVDTTITATMPWRNSTASWAIIGQEIDINGEPARIVDEIKLRRFTAMTAAAEGWERNFWGPPVAADDEVTPNGVNWWIVKNATEGFNGGAPSGFTTVAGINPTTYPRWRNWTFQYSAVSQSDLITKLWNASENTNFKSATPHASTQRGTTEDKKAYYTNTALYLSLKQILQSQNENLGPDLDPFGDGLMYRGRPVQMVPYLDADTTNPFYGIDWSYVRIYVLRNWWGRQTNIPNYPGQHTVSVNFLDWTYNWVWLNRRTSFVGATGVTYPS